MRLKHFKEKQKATKRVAAEAKVLVAMVESKEEDLECEKEVNLVFASEMVQLLGAPALYSPPWSCVESLLAATNTTSSPSGLAPYLPSLPASRSA